MGRRRGSKNRRGSKGGRGPEDKSEGAQRLSRDRHDHQRRSESTADNPDADPEPNTATNTDANHQARAAQANQVARWQTTCNHSPNTVCERCRANRQEIRDLNIINRYGSWVFFICGFLIGILLHELVVDFLAENRECDSDTE